MLSEISTIKIVEIEAVLILVIMDNALREGKTFFVCGGQTGVLILVIMDNALRGQKNKSIYLSVT